jgi:hypothetical protein
LIVQLNGKIGRRERAWPAPRLEEGCPTSTDDVDRAQVQLAPVERLANVALSKVGFLLVGERASAAKSSTATTFATASSRAAMRSLERPHAVDLGLDRLAIE